MVKRIKRPNPPKYVLFKPVHVGLLRVGVSPEDHELVHAARVQERVEHLLFGGEGVQLEGRLSKSAHKSGAVQPFRGALTPLAYALAHATLALPHVRCQT